MVTSSNLLDLSVALQPLSLDDIYHRLRDDKTLAEDILRLRRVRQMDEATYKRLKVRLPFFCCATFRDGIRRTGNFISAEAFVLDIDGVEAPAEIVARLTAQDERIALGFVSPGGSGVKLVFRLDEPCTDSKLFSDFYKAFTIDFARRYQLEQWVDTRTSDVTRACFLSHDPQAVFNPMADSVQWRTWLPEQLQPVLANLMHDQARPASSAPALSEEQSYPESVTVPVSKSHQIQPAVYAEILAKLKAKARPNPQMKSVFVPAVLDMLQPAVERALLDMQIRVLEVRPIQYGKQLVMQSGHDMAEVNIFYGKRGFSAVKVNRRNTNDALIELCVHIIEQVFYSKEAWEGQEQ